jgi:uncharacterized protein
MKYTLCITRQCNLRCNYCYISKDDDVMPLSVAQAAIDFAFKNTPREEKIDIGFFGGEPLLEFDLIKEITGKITSHPLYDRERVILTVVTNGTILDHEIIDFLIKNNIAYQVSCDGPPEIQDIFRSFTCGQGSSSTVEKNIKYALEAFGAIPVNAVFHPRTFHNLPDVIEYFSGLGLKQIYLNPDFSAPWTKMDADELELIYKEIGEQYIRFYLDGNPHFISLIDSKITVILRGGYQPLERCRMGKGEFAFSPQGNIYPCERLIGSGIGKKHCIGNIVRGFDIKYSNCIETASGPVNTECLTCGFNDYCMNWCGCSNYFSSGHYNRVSPIICAMEKAIINTAFHAFQTLDKKLGPVFAEHLSGMSNLNSTLKMVNYKV